MLQVPAALKLRVEPETEHTEVVELLKLAAKPDETVADKDNEVPTVCDAG